MEDNKITVRILKLIELHINNFKSFHGRKVLKDFSNFNCMIGPNGCGKSNFTDALSFVLGEKSSKLRVKKLEDLIHRSTIGLPVIKTASVEATFIVNKDTSDEEILIFSRMIQQSSCIYQCNNKIVSKVDYLNKLKEYGINVEFPNFLIYQGSIGDVALQNPQELRRHFEYIAGSTNLVKEYDELIDENKTLRNVTETLLTEKNNMKKVVKSAMSTRDEYKVYLEAKNQYDDQMRLKALISLFHLDKAIKNFKEQSDIAEKDSFSLNAELKALKQRLQEKRTLQKDGSREITESDETIQKRQTDLHKMKLSVVKSKEALNNAEKKLKDCQQQIAQNNIDLISFDKTIEDVLAKMKRSEKKQDRCKISGISEEHKSMYRSLKQDAAVIHGKTFDIHNEEREDQADNDIIDTLKTESKALESYIRMNEAGKKNCVERITKLNEKLAEYRTLGDQRQKNTDTVILLKQRIKSIEERLIENENIQVSIEEYKRQETRNSALKEMQRAFKGVFDRVSNCCSVNNSKYKIPLTKVVGMRNMNAIIVDNESTAQKCIGYLKLHKHPPETFLPISFVKVTSYKQIAESSKSAAVVLLKNTLIYDHKYENIMCFICKGTYVCENEQTLQILYEQKINVVNLEGSYYQRSGLISGGVTDLARKAEQWTSAQESVIRSGVAKLKEELTLLKQQLAQIHCQKDVCFDPKQVETILDVVGEDIKETEKGVAKFDEKINKQKADLKKIQNEIDLYQTKVTNRESILNEVNANISRVFTDFCKNLNITNVAEFENMEQQKIDVDNELNRFQIELDYVKKSKETLNNHKTVLQKHLSEFDKQHKASLENQEISARNLQSASFTMDEAKKNRANKLKKLQEVDSSATKLSKEHSELLKTCEAARNAQNKLTADINTHKQQFNTEFTQCIVDGIEIPLTESGGSQDILIDHYSNVVIDYTQIPEKYCRFTDIKNKHFRKELDNLGQEINTLRRKVESGSLYLSTHGMGRDKHIESLREKLEAKEKQYREAVERYHTVTQKITTLAQIRNERLTALLDSIKTFIKPMYSDLTGDTTGNVFLQFENTEKPFEGGITYNIILPQKTFMPLDSLSGGESTLAGILLLLAIQKYSRCPTLILDEIDAPLDRPNAAKLFEYLGKVSADLQIFLITHNEEAYAPAELLIGFTKMYIQERELDSKVVMLSCENYQ